MPTEDDSDSFCEDPNARPICPHCKNEDSVEKCDAAAINETCPSSKVDIGLGLIHINLFSYIMAP